MSENIKSKKIRKTIRLNKIDWNGPYADEKYAWQCSRCKTKYGSQNEARNCYDSHEETIYLNKLLKEYPFLKIVKRTVHNSRSFENRNDSSCSDCKNYTMLIDQHTYCECTCICSKHPNFKHKGGFSSQIICTDGNYRG